MWQKRSLTGLLTKSTEDDHVYGIKNKTGRYFYCERNGKKICKMRDHRRCMVSGEIAQIFRNAKETVLYWKSARFCQAICGCSRG